MKKNPVKKNPAWEVEVVCIYADTAINPRTEIYNCFDRQFGRKQGKAVGNGRRREKGMKIRVTGSGRDRILKDFEVPITGRAGALPCEPGVLERDA